MAAQTSNKLPDFVQRIPDKCQKHKREFEVYCGLHEQACCAKCVSNDHKKCKDLRKLSEVLANVKSSALMSNIDDELAKLLQNHDKVLKHLYEQTSSVKEQTYHQINEIRKIRSELNLCLDRLEKHCIQQLEQGHQKLDSEFIKLKNEIEAKQKHAFLMVNVQDLIKKHATDLQTFLSLDVVNKMLQKETEFMKGIQDHKELYETKIDISLSSTLDLLYNLDHLGEIVVSRGNTPIQLECNETAQFALPMSEQAIENIRLVHLKTYQLSKGNNEMLITGCDLLPNGDFVVADRNVQYVKHFDNKGMLVKKINTESQNPADVCCIDNTTIVISLASSYKDHIIFVDSASNKVINKVKVGNGEKFVSFDKVLVVGRKAISRVEIILLDIEGNLLNKFKTNKIGGVLASNNLIYYTEHYRNEVVCSDISGNILWKSEPSPNIRWPCSVAVDNRGFVFVACYDSNSLVVLCPNGQNNKVIVDQSKGLKKPVALKIDRSKRKLFICNETDGKAFLYQL